MVLSLGLIGAAPALAAGPAAAEPARAQAAPADFTAHLSGDQEVPTPGGPAVGDRDGSAVARVKINGDRLSFRVQWRKIDAPTLGHIHQGVRGQNGPIKVDLFSTPVPAHRTETSGTVRVDRAVSQAIRSNPGGFYVNIHNGRFPGGAVRGQLHR
jgi:hypothetical protein